VVFEMHTPASVPVLSLISLWWEQAGLCWALAATPFSSSEFHHLKLISNFLLIVTENSQPAPLGIRTNVPY